MLFVDEFCGILVYIKFGADVTSQYDGDADVFPYETEYTVRLLRSNNIQDARFMNKNIQFVNSDRVKMQQYICQDDIMVCMANGSKSLVGKSCYFNKSLSGKYSFGAFMGCLRRKNDDVNMYYIFNLMNSSLYWEKIAILFSGSSINNLRPSDILNMKFMMPTFDEQNAINRLLLYMDTEIDTLFAKLEKARNMKKGMMSELLTGRIRLV